MGWISVFRRGGGDWSCSLSAMRGHGEQATMCKPGRVLSPEPDCIGTLILNLQAPEPWEMCYLCRLIYGVLFWQPKLRQALRNSSGVFMFLVDNSLEDTYLLGTQSGRNDEGVANLVCRNFFHFRELKKNTTALFPIKVICMVEHTALVQLRK